MKRPIYFSLFIVVLAALTGCKPDPVNPPPDIGPVNYTQDISAIVYNNCQTCHAGPVPSAGIALTTYQEVRAQTEHGNLNNRVNDEVNPMPPRGLLPEEDRLKIEKWMEDGFPEG